MTYGNERSLEYRILQWAQRMMPPQRTSWVSAMEAEIRAIPSSGDRFLFAVGCLATAVIERVRTRNALAWIGRSIVAAGLFFMSAYGIFLTLQASNLDPANAKLVLSLCAIYALAAPLIMLSLHALCRFAGVGLISAIVAAFWFSMSGTSYLGLSANYLTALSLEAGLLMGALLLAGVYLSLLYGQDTEITPDV